MVALLAEGVDRNNSVLLSTVKNQSSPSSRRAWIEIPMRFAAGIMWTVALLAEGVDRNMVRISFLLSWWVALLAEGVDRNRLPPVFLPPYPRRPPRGGRG